MVTLPFDFARDGVEPGTYSGFVRVESENAETVRIPLEITLRNPFLYGPFLVFVVGALLGYALHLYRSKYRDRLLILDTIETQEALLQKEQSGPGGKPTIYYAFYGEPGARKLAAAKRLLRDAGWEGNVAAAKALADTVRGWQARWAEHEDAFCEAWQRLQGLRSEFDANGKYTANVIKAAPRYLPARRDALNAIAGQLHTYATGEELKAPVDAEAQRLGRFDLVWNQMERIQIKIEKLAANLQPDFQKRLDAQRAKLAEADTDEDVAAILGELAPLEKDVYAALHTRALALDVPPDIEPGVILYQDDRAAGGDVAARRGLGQRLGSAARTIWEDPDTWLFAFGVLAHVVAFAGLLALGYGYWNGQATFGKDRFDYVNLFFVGFAGISTTNTLINSALTPLRGWILQQQEG